VVPVGRRPLESPTPPSVKCPYCKQDNNRVIDSRASDDAFAIRRRRECNECGRRYTTYEKVEETMLRVIKKDGTREPFDRGKILSGLLKACEKRPVSTQELEETADRIERRCHETFDREIDSKAIGAFVMEELKRIDQVAYVRFASVYREFKDVAQFLDELKPFLEKHDPLRPDSLRPESGRSQTGGRGQDREGNRT